MRLHLEGVYYDPVSTWKVDVNPDENKEREYSAINIHRFIPSNRRDYLYWTGMAQGKESGLNLILDKEWPLWWVRIQNQAEIDRKRKEEEALKRLKKLIITMRLPTMGAWTKLAKRDPADVHRVILSQEERRLKALMLL